MEIPLDEVVTFDECTADPTASGGVSDADSTPTFSVFEDANDTPILSAQNFTKRTSLTGNYRGAFTASAGNGFEVGKWYNVISTAVVGGITGKKKSMTFRLVAAESIAGVPKADVAYSLGVAVVNSDFTIASATSSTVTLPTTYTDTTALPDDNRYIWTYLSVVSGTGQGQNVILTTATGSPRQYNVFSGTMPVQLDNTSKCVVGVPVRSNASLVNVTVATNLDKGNYTLEASAQATLVSSIQSGLATATAVDALPTNAELATALGTADDAVLTQVALVKAKTDLIPASPASTTNITAAAGVALAATGLDAITATTPTGVASTFPQKLMQLWARFFGRAVRDDTTIKTYQSNGTSVATTQTYTASGTDEDIGAAS